MRSGPRRRKSEVNQVSGRELILLVELEPRYKAFFGNLAAAIFTRAATLNNGDADWLWPDVFVRSDLPWGKLLQSAAYHLVAIAALLAWSRVLPQHSPTITRPVFQRSEVVTFDSSDYLPPLDTGGRATVRRKGDPAYAAQPIISVPPEPDNRRQTIVAPPAVKLSRDVPLPNIVAWQRPAPAPPLQVAPESKQPPELAQTVVGPSPDIHGEVRPSPAALPEAVAPAPIVAINEIRKPGNIDIAPAAVIAPAPELPVAAQRTFAPAAQVGMPSAISPPPSISGVANGHSAAQLIALNIEPAAPASIEEPGGNRRGEFAATPEGHANAAGTPDIAGEDAPSGGTGNSGHSPGSSTVADNLPPGLFVGAAPKAPHTLGGGAGGNGNPFAVPRMNQLMADAMRPRTRPLPSEVPDEKVSDLEHQVFRDRRFYAMVLNLPNLNSDGGSWVMHFAELRESAQGKLIGPVPTQAVDPAYPAELMRDNVQGTVTLYAVIHSDGSVSDVRVLQGVDDRLDSYARAALSRWRFRPAMKNGNAVALEAVVSIPFRSAHREF